MPHFNPEPIRLGKTGLNVHTKIQISGPRVLHESLKLAKVQTMSCGDLFGKVCLDHMAHFHSVGMQNQLNMEQYSVGLENVMSVVKRH